MKVTVVFWILIVSGGVDGNWPMPAHPNYGQEFKLGTDCNAFRKKLTHETYGWARFACVAVAETTQ